MAQRSHLRASDADRERIADRLREATAEGRLAAHELDQRLGVALSARTYGELNSTVADIPGARLGQPRRGSQRAIAVARRHPIVMFAAIPVILVALAMALAVTVLWMTIVVLAALMGERRRPRPPWLAARHRHGRRAADSISPWP